MCIIAAKPAGIPLPDHDTLRRMWENNSDGAGFMYTDKVSTKKGKSKLKVIIEKGFMDYNSFRVALSEVSKRIDTTATPMVLHFRITTHGGTCPELTHPFPVTSSEGALKKLHSSAEVGIAHNGIIHSVVVPKGMSDTAEYVRSQLAPLTKALPRWFESAPALEMVKNAIGSKMAVLSADGKLATIGEFTEENGVLYSNTTFRYNKYTYSYGHWGGWDTYSSDCAPWDNAVSRKLMSISCSEGAYIATEDGGLHDETENEYAISRIGDVYEYDEIIGGYVRLSGARAYNAEGMKLRFNEKYATYEDTYSESDAEDIYSILFEDEEEPTCDPLPEELENTLPL